MAGQRKRAAIKPDLDIVGIATALARDATVLLSDGMLHPVANLRVEAIRLFDVIVHAHPAIGPGPSALRARAQIDLV